MNERPNSLLLGFGLFFGKKSKDKREKTQSLAEYLVFKDRDYLKIGGGLIIVNGLSRFTQPSVGTILSMDVPVFAQATVDQTDEFARKLSLYARGQVGRIDYRVAISDPFPVQTNGAAPPVPRRPIRFMNPASGTTQSVRGLGGTQGNAFPMFGTGSVIYSQVGYLFRQDLLGSNGTLMPCAQAKIGNYDRVNQSMGVYNVGLNWLIKGHNSKITLDYQNRPYYIALPATGQLDAQGRRGQLVLQYQVYI